MTSLYSFIKRVYTSFNPPVAPLLLSESGTTSPIKFGILGAARIAPPALIIPAKSHSEVVVYAVAARSIDKAKGFAKTHGIEKVYGGADAYQELLNDPEIDAVYNPLPNGLHYEWTMKALQAGKHVLLEKPSTNTAEETKKLFDYAKEKGLVLLEAFHYRFHPAPQRVKEIIDSGEIGALKSLEATMAIPAHLLKNDDIRFDYDLGGGGLMDMGCYTINILRYLTSSEPLSILSATADPFPGRPNVDSGTSATLSFPNDIAASLTCHLRMPWKYGGLLPGIPQMKVKVEGENGDILLWGFPLVGVWHYIEVGVKDGKGGKGRKSRIEKLYKPKEGKGEEWWSTYRYQLEAFVDQLKGRTPQTWVTAEDSIGNMEVVEKVYEKSGLGSRPKSTWVLPVL